MARGELFHVKHFTVEGQGDFPLDMLRFDRCFPKTGFDASKIDWYQRIETRTIELVTHVRHNQSWPGIDRWRSFGWKVVTIHGKAV